MGKFYVVFVEGFEQLPPHLWGNKQTLLCSPVIHKKQSVYLSLGPDLHLFQIEPVDCINKLVKILSAFREINIKVFSSSEELESFKRAGTCALENEGIGTSAVIVYFFPINSEQLLRQNQRSLEQ